MNGTFAILYLLISVLPAWIINQYLLKWIQPKRSMKYFLLYILSVLAIAFLYTFIVCWILFKYVWPVK
jgi:hypothetical protein